MMNRILLLYDSQSGNTEAACRLLGKRLAEWTAAFVHGRKQQHPLNKPSERQGPG